MTAQHLIEQLEFDLSFDSVRQASQRESELAAYIQQRLLPLADQVFSEFSRVGQLIRIDSLELDLGDIAEADFEHGMAQRFVQQLRLSLQHSLQQIGQSDQVQVLDLPQSAYQQLLAFLESGYLAPHAQVNFDRLLGLVLTDSADPFLLYLRQHRQPERIVQRLSQQFSAESLYRLLSLLQSYHQPSQVLVSQDLADRAIPIAQQLLRCLQPVAKASEPAAALLPYASLQQAIQQFEKPYWANQKKLVGIAPKLRLAYHWMQRLAKAKQAGLASFDAADPHLIAEWWQLMAGRDANESEWQDWAMKQGPRAALIPLLHSFDLRDVAIDDVQSAGQRRRMGMLQLWFGRRLNAKAVTAYGPQHDRRAMAALSGVAQAVNRPIERMRRHGDRLSHVGLLPQKAKWLRQRHLRQRVSARLNLTTAGHSIDLMMARTNEMRRERRPAIVSRPAMRPLLVRRASLGLATPLQASGQTLNTRRLAKQSQLAANAAATAFQARRLGRDVGRTMRQPSLVARPFTAKTSRYALSRVLPSLARSAVAMNAFRSSTSKADTPTVQRRLPGLSLAKPVSFEQQQAAGRASFDDRLWQQLRQPYPSPSSLARAAEYAAERRRSTEVTRLRAAQRFSANSQRRQPGLSLAKPVLFEQQQAAGRASFDDRLWQQLRQPYPSPSSLARAAGYVAERRRSTEVTRLRAAQRFSANPQRRLTIEWARNPRPSVLQYRASGIELKKRDDTARQAAPRRQLLGRQNKVVPQRLSLSREQQLSRFETAIEPATLAQGAVRRRSLLSQPVVTSEARKGRFAQVAAINRSQWVSSQRAKPYRSDHSADWRVKTVAKGAFIHATRTMCDPFALSKFKPLRNPISVRLATSKALRELMLQERRLVTATTALKKRPWLANKPLSEGGIETAIAPESGVTFEQYMAVLAKGWRDYVDNLPAWLAAVMQADRRAGWLLLKQLFSDADAAANLLAQTLLQHWGLPLQADAVIVPRLAALPLPALSALYQYLSGISGRLSLDATTAELMLRLLQQLKLGRNADSAAIHSVPSPQLQLRQLIDEPVVNVSASELRQRLTQAWLGAQPELIKAHWQQLCEQHPEWLRELVSLRAPDVAWSQRLVATWGEAKLQQWLHAILPPQSAWLLRLLQQPELVSAKAALWYQCLHYLYQHGWAANCVSSFWATCLQRRAEVAMPYRQLLQALHQAERLPASQLAAQQNYQQLLLRLQGDLPQRMMSAEIRQLQREQPALFQQLVSALTTQTLVLDWASLSLAELQQLVESVLQQQSVASNLQQSIAQYAQTQALSPWFWYQLLQQLLQQQSLDLELAAQHDLSPVLDSLNRALSACDEVALTPLWAQLQLNHSQWLRQRLRFCLQHAQWRERAAVAFTSERLLAIWCLWLPGESAWLLRVLSPIVSVNRPRFWQYALTYCGDCPAAHFSRTAFVQGLAELNLAFSTEQIDAWAELTLHDRKHEPMVSLQPLSEVVPGAGLPNPHLQQLVRDGEVAAILPLWDGLLRQYRSWLATNLSPRLAQAVFRESLLQLASDKQLFDILALLNPAWLTLCQSLLASVASLQLKHWIRWQCLQAAAARPADFRPWSGLRAIAVRCDADEYQQLMAALAPSLRGLLQQATSFRRLPLVVSSVVARYRLSRSLRPIKVETPVADQSSPVRLYYPVSRVRLAQLPSQQRLYRLLWRYLSGELVGRDAELVSWLRQLQALAPRLSQQLVAAMRSRQLRLALDKLGMASHQQLLQMILPNAAMWHSIVEQGQQAKNQSYYYHCLLQQWQAQQALDLEAAAQLDWHSAIQQAWSQQNYAQFEHLWQQMRWQHSAMATALAQQLLATASFPQQAVAVLTSNTLLGMIVRLSNSRELLSWLQGLQQADLSVLPRVYQATLNYLRHSAQSSWDRDAYYQAIFSQFSESEQVELLPYWRASVEVRLPVPSSVNPVLSASQAEALLRLGLLQAKREVLLSSWPTLLRRYPQLVMQFLAQLLANDVKLHAWLKLADRRLLLDALQLWLPEGSHFVEQFTAQLASEQPGLLQAVWLASWLYFRDQTHLVRSDYAKFLYSRFAVAEQEKLSRILHRLDQRLPVVDGAQQRYRELLDALAQPQGKSFELWLKQDPSLLSRLIEQLKQGQLTVNCDALNRQQAELLVQWFTTHPEAGVAVAFQQAIDLYAEQATDRLAYYRFILQQLLKRQSVDLEQAIQQTSSVSPHETPHWSWSQTTGGEILEDLYIANAGMVLLNPYIPRLFDMLGLVAEGKFKDQAAAERAVHLLQYAVNERCDLPEFMLPLNKILCGIVTGTPIIGRIEIRADERELIDGLLQAVIQHWRILGNTTLAGLRESFLQRPARLQLKGEEWHMQVETKGIDVLLDKLPWSYGLIKYSWMLKPVFVEWRE